MEKKQFKGWGILVAAFIMSFIPTAVLNNCFALYMNPVCTDLGFSTGSWSLVNLIASLTSAIGAMIVAGWYQKKNMKVMMCVCTIGTALCFVLATFATKLWMMYIIFGVENIFLAGLTQLPISMLVTAWFESKRSTMMSIAMAGGGVGGLIWSPILSKMIAASTSGWKTAMIFSAVLTAVVMCLVAIFLVKRSPAEYGTEPYRTGDASEADAAAAQAAPQWIGVSKQTAKKSSAWKASIGVVMLVGALASGVTTHVPNFITTIAQDGGVFQGTVLSIYSLVSIAGMVGGGVIMDKVGIKNTVLIAVALVAVGLGCVAGVGFTGKLTLAYGYCIFFALAMCLPKLLPAILFSEVYGVKDYGSIYANLNLFFLIGAALGSVLTSILAGILGYALTWIVYIVFAVLMYLCVSAALKGGEKLKEEYPNGDDVEVA
ncbi:MAG: MFS transporter [Oscillospiraceae bacterium]|nr:MFS transporter [Oscillospiraceae bacterium]